MFERKIEVNGEPVVLRFKNFAEVPYRISFFYTGDSEEQLKQSLIWGLTEPKNWPVDSDNPGVEVMTELSTQEVMKIHNEWQAAAKITLGESSASTTSSPDTATS